MHHRIRVRIKSHYRELAYDGLQCFTMIWSDLQWFLIYHSLQRLNNALHDSVLQCLSMGLHCKLYKLQFATLGRTVYIIRPIGFAAQSSFLSAAVFKCAPKHSAASSAATSVCDSVEANDCLVEEERRRREPRREAEKRSVTHSTRDSRVGSVPRLVRWCILWLQAHWLRSDL